MDAGNAIGNWAGGGATTTLGAVQTGYGMYLDKKNKRPDATIPPEIYQNLSQAQLLAMQGMPEQTKQEYINSIMRSQSYGLSQLGNRSAGLQGVVGLNQNANDSMLKLAGMDAQQRLANQGELMKQRQNLADYKQQLFQINQLNPYYENVAKSQALIGAGMQNMSQGFQAGNIGNVDWGGNKSPQEQQPQEQQPQDNAQNTIYAQPQQKSVGAAQAPNYNYGAGGMYGIEFDENKHPL